MANINRHPTNKTMTATPLSKTSFQLALWTSREKQQNSRISQAQQFSAIVALSLENFYSNQHPTQSKEEPLDDCVQKTCRCIVNLSGTMSLAKLMRKGGFASLSALLGALVIVALSPTAADLYGSITKVNEIDKRIYSFLPSYEGTIRDEEAKEIERVIIFAANFAFPVGNVESGSRRVRQRYTRDMTGYENELQQWFFSHVHALRGTGEVGMEQIRAQVIHLFGIPNG